MKITKIPPNLGYYNMIHKLAPDEYKKKYHRYLFRSYVEDSRKIKWCPAPGCESAAEYVVGSGNYDVTSSCSYSCWNVMHRGSSRIGSPIQDFLSKCVQVIKTDNRVS
ncbi:putative E3 ubiquitin-protein ligase ari7 [Orobanche gracilis]